MYETYIYFLHLYSFINPSQRWYIANSQYGHLPVGLIAQLVEHCTGIAEVIFRFLFRPEFFSGFIFETTLSCINNCDIYFKQRRQQDCSDFYCGLLPSSEINGADISPKAFRILDGNLLIPHALGTVEVATLPPVTPQNVTTNAKCNNF